jgi:exonuclease VII large subunit
MPDLFDLPFEEEAKGPPRRVFTVTELTVGVRDLLEERFSEIWVEGELSNCKTWNTRSKA